MSLDLRLALPAALMWIAAGITVGFPSAAIWFAVFAWGIGAAALFWGLCTAGPRTAGPRAWAGTLAVSAAAVATVATVVMVEAPVRSPSILVDAAVARTTVELDVRVDSVVRRIAGTISGSGSPTETLRGTLLRVFPVAAQGDDSRNSPAASLAGAVQSPVRIFLPALSAGQPRPTIGDRVRLTGTLRIAEAGRSEAFVVTSSGEMRRTGTAPAWLSWANSARSGLAAAAANLPGDGGALLPGLAIGETSGLDSGLDDAMRQSALSHLTAVSGANCSVVVALAMLAASAIGLRRVARAVCALVVLAAFVVLVTPDASVIRAAVMGAIVILSGLAGRTARGLPVLAAAVVCLVVQDPWIAQNYGFVLSVLATGGLIVLAPRLAVVMSRWMPPPLAAVIAIPVAAQVACQPVLILLEPTLPVYGVLANLLAGPAAPAATILGLFACALLPFAPGLGFACAQLAWAPSAWIAAVARTADRMPGRGIPWPDGFIGVALLAILTAAVLVVFLWRGRRSRGVRVAAGVAALLVLFGYLGVAAGRYAIDRLVRPSEWVIAMCDVGQGDAFVVRSGERHALIDTGPDPQALSACLHSLRIDRIDLLVLTHFDLDHVGGLDAVVDRVDLVLVGPSEGPADRRLTAALTRHGSQVHQAASGDAGSLGSLRWRVLWPNAESILMQTGNDGSVTVAFEGDELSALFLGDLGQDSQNAMMAHNALGEFDVVKVAHHGSADQSEILYRRVRARLGLVSAGVGNRYGHPRSSILETLENAGTQVARTDRHGLVLVWLDPSDRARLQMWCERADEAETDGG